MFNFIFYLFYQFNLVKIFFFNFKSGKIASKVRNEALSRIRENIPLIEIAEYAENRIEDLGARPAFPCNISINEIASHYTPQDDQFRFKKGDVVKLDIGVHVEGFITDTAATIEIGADKHRFLIQASEEALTRAIESVKDRVETNYIGKIIEETIKDHGFNPIKDLTGHNLERYKLHAGVAVPNYRSFFSHTIRKDMILAIEPFATYGSGNIKNGKPFIFSIDDRCKGNAARQVMNRFFSLPFTKRWIPDIKMDELKGAREYYELIERDGEIVTQSEHTVIVHEEECEIITL